MGFEMAMLMNWLLVAAGLLASDLFSGLFEDDSGDGDDAVGDEEEVLVGEPQGQNLGLGTGDDVHTGSEFDDIVLGQAGDDVIEGGDGDDMIEGNTDDDLIYGGAGDDVLAGGGDTDTIYGGDGDDVLSSDRVDENGDWTRGEDEVLDGGAGDDRLFFADGDKATGGEGADTFGLIQTGDGTAQVTDFAAGEDNVVIYVDGLAGGEASPIISYNANVEDDSTTVSLDGEPVLVFAGTFTPQELGVTLEDTNAIEFGAAA